MADPGFPVGGGAEPLGGVPTSDVGTFWQKCMRKQKNWILLGGRAGGTPLDLPMVYCQFFFLLDFESTSSSFNRCNASKLLYAVGDEQLSIADPIHVTNPAIVKIATAVIDKT